SSDVCSSDLRSAHRPTHPRTEREPTMRIHATALSFPLLALAMAVVPAAQADDDRACKHSAPQSLTLDIGDARRVEFRVGNSKLRLDGKPGKAGSLQGRACASSADDLA